MLNRYDTTDNPDGPADLEAARKLPKQQPGDKPSLVSVWGVHQQSVRR